MKTPGLALAAIALVALASGAQAAISNSPAVVPSSNSVQPDQKLDELDEIWVRGKSLSAVIEEAEDDFFDLYNKLNKDSQYRRDGKQLLRGNFLSISKLRNRLQFQRRCLWSDSRLLEKVRSLDGLYKEMDVVKGRYVKVKGDGPAPGASRATRKGAGPNLGPRRL